ncbi:MAG TPA: hypothetical protein PLF31_00150 [Candidatus Paceibacterota bacterium]|nr:hypothetical protein [Candidatus Paceibacterota bacterium]
MNKNTATIVISGLIGLIVGIALTWGFMQDDQKMPERLDDTENASTTVTVSENTDTTANTTNNTNTSSPASVNTDLEVADQDAGMSVLAKATVSVPTWVVITEDVSGQQGRILGARLYFPGSPEGKVELLRATTEGATYHAVIYTDNGDKKFDHKVDAPARTSTGAFLEETFKAE